MNILIIGSGGREHALAWKLKGSPGVSLYALPGNPGTAQLATNIDGHPDRPGEVIDAVRQYGIDLVVIGPEGPLAAGLADALLADEGLAGKLRVFGPTAAAAQIESSKAFAKEFMARHAIPTAQGRTFTDLPLALEYLQGQEAHSIVIKASGLAAGKGVFLPDSQHAAEAALRSLLDERALGEAGREVVIEERLVGREVSLLAFTDGFTVVPMPPAQDHKRLLDGDMGPNTGGMGAYAPSPACPPELVRQAVSEILQPAVDGLRLEGRPFVGVLYAGLMLTPAGLRVLEFNARFGDPETQVLLPLLASDLLEIMVACTDGRLAEMAGRIHWQGSAACVILAANGYPSHPASDSISRGKPIHGLDLLGTDTLAFHSGTMVVDGEICAGSGRVLGVTGRGSDLRSALERAYAGVARLQFAGQHYRRDIGQDTLSVPEGARPSPKGSAYEMAGVSIAAGNRSVEMMKAAVRSTFTPQVLGDIGSFGGLYDVSGLKEIPDPVLVASTDGVGTKVDLAAQAGKVYGLGFDIVNHCINDILVQGARPLFFLDYLAADRLDPEAAAELVRGISAACREAGCALLGGETAEMPGVYAPGHFDLAGTIVGLVRASMRLPRTDVRPGDRLIGLASSGPHTNGYSLIRKIFAGVPLETVYPELGQTLADSLLAPHRSYLPLIEPLLGEGSPAKALAHLTGGGFIDNLPRVLPEGCGVCVDTKAWPVPPLFGLIQKLGGVETQEMYHVFNQGIGMVIITSIEDENAVQSRLPEQSWIIGEVIAGKGVKLV